MHQWAGEVVIDVARVRGLIGGQFPELDVASARPLAEGWDNSVWVLEERWAFRFPRRQLGVGCLLRELDVLPRLAGRLPLPIPAPQFLGRPADDYPWPFFGAPLLPGREIADARLDDDARARLAQPLAAFLRALHATELPGLDLPDDPNGRADMTLRVARAHEQLAELERLGLWRAPASIGPLLDKARALPAPTASVLAHGDLHFRHVLVDDNRAAAAVIDWGDVCRGDPSIDLPLLWCLLPPDARPTFLATYGPVSDEQLLRARVLALFLCAVLAVYAHHEGLEAVRREALASLARAASD